MEVLKMQAEKKIAIYLRLSLEDRDVKRNDVKSESESISNQRYMLKDYVKSKKEFSGREIIEFKDDGYSGTNFDRPMFQKLMREVRLGTISVIIVKDFSRLGRDYLESGNYLDRVFPAYGVRFIAVNDHYDSKSHMGETTDIDVSLKNVINDLYSKDISKKNKTALRIRMKQGEHTAGYVFYGYKKNPDDRHKIVIDEPAANIVRRIFDYSIKGISTYKIARILNDEKIDSPNEYKKKQGIFLNGRRVMDRTHWIGSTVKKIIQDERYTGKMIFHKYETSDIELKKVVLVPKKDWIIVEGTHEPIISMETYQKANEALSARMRTPGKKGTLERKNLFTCACCRHKLEFTGGEKHDRYISCRQAVVTGDPGCSKIHFEKEKIEQAVIVTLNTMGKVFLEEKKIKKLEENHNAPIKSEIKIYNKKIESLKQNNRKDYMLMKEGKLSREEYLNRRNELSEQINEIEKKIKNNERQIEDNKKHLNQNAELLPVMDDCFLIKEFDQDSLRKILKAIYVDEQGNVELDFRKQDILKEMNSKYSDM